MLGGFFVFGFSFWGLSSACGRRNLHALEFLIMASIYIYIYIYILFFKKRSVLGGQRQGLGPFSDLERAPRLGLQGKSIGYVSTRNVQVRAHDSACV